MNAPLIWIIIPFFAAVALWFVQQKRKLSLISAVSLCFLLGLIALFQKIDSAMRIGPLAINVQSTMNILGRSLVLDNPDRIYLAFIYLSLVFWYLSASAVKVSTKFIPLSMAVVALLTAGLAVEPFLYSAILIELAVIISLPLLIKRGSAIGKGLLRYLIFQSLALPMIMLAGWILSGVQTSFSDINQLYIAALLLGLGFAFWLGIFPFHMWIPEFSTENDPFINGFVLSIYPIAVILIMIDYINGLTWLKDASFVQPALAVCGTLMVVTGGIWAAIQTDLRRIFGYAVIIETGFMLLSISLRNEMGIQLFYYCIFTRALELAVLTLSITLLHGDDPGLRLNYPKAMTWKNSPSVFVLLAGLFSCVGMPMFASFPVRALLFTQFSGQPGIVLWVLLGSIAFMLIPFKVLRIIFRNHEQEWQMTDTIAKMTLGIVGILALLLVGILPSLFLEAIWNKLSIFLTM